MRRLAYLFYLLLGFLLLFGCSSKPSKPPPTNLVLVIKAGSDINPSDIDKASPVQARLYELTDNTLFQQADFLSLYLEDTATLQSTLIKKHPLPTIQPGSDQTVNFQLDSATRYVAILAEFSQYQTAVAQISEAVIPNQNNILILNINDNHLRLKPSNDQTATMRAKGTREKEAKRKKNGP